MPNDLIHKKKFDASTDVHAHGHGEGSQYIESGAGDQGWDDGAASSIQ